MKPTFPPSWNSKLARGVHKCRMIPSCLDMFTQVAWYGKTPPLWNFNLVWHVHKGKTISKFRPPVGFQIGLACPHVQDDNRSGLWDSKLICHVHKGRMISNFPSPWNFKLTLGCPQSQMISWVPPHGTSKWLKMFTRERWFQTSQPHGTSNWLGMPTMELQIDMGCPQGYDDIKFSTALELQTDLECSKEWGYQNSYHDGTSNWHGMFTRVRWDQNSTRMEFQIDLGVLAKKNDIKLPIPMELQFDLACSKR